MGVVPPRPGVENSEAPIDRALSLALTGEREAALRWAASIVKHDPGSAVALCLCGRLLGDLGRAEAGREASALAVQLANDLGNLPLAVVAADELARCGGDPGPSLDAIAVAGVQVARDRAEAPPPPPAAVQPLPSVLTGAALLGKATQLIHDARKRLTTEGHRPSIAALPLFASMGRDGLGGVCRALEPLWVAQGATVVRQGGAASEVYFVAHGELEVRRERDGASAVVARLGAGSIFGEMALLSRAPRSVGVSATRPSIVVHMKTEALTEIATRHPQVGARLAAHCSKRMLQSVMSTCELLTAIPATDRPALFERFQTRTFEKNEKLMVQDAPPPGMFVIASGEVAVVRRDESGDRFVLSTLRVGDLAGEVAVMLRRKANADFIATHPSLALFLPAAELPAILRAHPAILVELYRLAFARDEETTSVIEEEATAVEDFVLI